MENQKVWFITGASKGIGLVLVQKLLASGAKVAATSRNAADLKQAVGTDSPDFLPLAVNIIDENSVHEAVARTIDTFGRMDVVVNNAGYGLLGGLEELTDKEARANFDVNVFGSLHVIRKAMPQLRKQQSGHVINISSIGGVNGAFPGFGIYCATKFAVVGFTEALATEVSAFGIKATVVEPGYFRTSFLTSDSLVTPANGMEEYREVRESQEQHQNQINGNQPGDPAKAADAIIRLTEAAHPPVHLLLGQDAFEMARAQFAYLSDEMEQWKSLTVSTGFEPATI